MDFTVLDKFMALRHIPIAFTMCSLLCNVRFHSCM